MPTKQEVIDSLDKQRYEVGQVVYLINSIKLRTEIDYQPKYIKKGDVYLDGFKGRPHIVFKVVGDVAYSVALTSTEDAMNLTQAKNSRFLKPVDNCFVSKGVYVAKCDFIAEHFICVYDNPKELNRIIKLKREEMLGLF